MKRSIYILVLIMFFNCFSFAQTGERKYCGTSKVMEDALKNPEKKQVLDQLEIFTQEFIKNLDNIDFDLV